MSHQIVLAALAAVGHLALSAMIYNRLHALPLGKKTRDVFERFLFVWAAAALLWMAWHVISNRSLFAAPAFAAYGVICIAALFVAAAAWVWRRCTFRVPKMLLSNHTRTLDIAHELGYRPVGKLTYRLAAAIPGNQLLELDVNEKRFELPELNPTLDGLSITHITDLHFTGGQTRAYYEYVCDQAQRLDSDLIAITGDIVDDQRLVSWIPETLGRLRAPGGVYYVLGNHDRCLPDVLALRRSLNETGLIDLGSCWREIDLGGGKILLSGNERVWFDPPPEPPEPAAGGQVLRVLLSHSPDQIGWARRHQFDLMLAGHTHGGQVRLPLTGPFIAPSRFGVKYASGVFYEEPTLMHVSRGISAEHPVRFNCRPELTRIVLRAPRKGVPPVSTAGL